jgi:DUF438 domain-containing protein
MRLANFEKDQEKDKIEQVKQQVQEIQTDFDYKIIPQKNHTLFEVNLSLKTIEIAEFDELPAVKFEEAMKGNIVSQKKVTKKENCVYISSLNKKNVLKILKRDFRIACL